MAVCRTLTFEIFAWISILKKLHWLCQKKKMKKEISISFQLYFAFYLRKFNPLDY